MRLSIFGTPPKGQPRQQKPIKRAHITFSFWHRDGRGVCRGSSVRRSNPCGKGMDASRPTETMNLEREVNMGKRVRIILGLAILGLGVGAMRASRGAASGADVSALKVTIREWDVPTKGAHPHDPAVGPDGALWFTEQLQNKLGRVDPKTGIFKEYALKIEDSGPHGLVADSNGNIWFTGNGKGYIGKLDPRSGSVTEYMMPDAEAEDPHTAVFDSHGILWFTVQVGNMVGRLDPHTGKVDLKAVQGQRALPYGIAVNSKGVPFFCEFGTNKMASINPRTMAITEFKLPEGARPRRMAIDSEDRIYFTDYEGGNLGRLDPGT